MATPKQTDPQFKLRMTPELKEAIENAADLNGRSMNAEILDRLTSSFARESLRFQSYQQRDGKFAVRALRSNGEIVFSVVCGDQPPEFIVPQPKGAG